MSGLLNRLRKVYQSAKVIRMDLKEYVKGLPAKKRPAFAKRAGTTKGYLDLLMGGHRQPSPELARKLEAASGGAVSLTELRPDIWRPDEARSA